MVCYALIVPHPGDCHKRAYTGNPTRSPADSQAENLCKTGYRLILEPDRKPDHRGKDHECNDFRPCKQGTGTNRFAAARRRAFLVELPGCSRALGGPVPGNTSGAGRARGQSDPFHHHRRGSRAPIERPGCQLRRSRDTVGRGLSGCPSGDIHAGASARCLRRRPAGKRPDHSPTSDPAASGPRLRRQLSADSKTLVCQCTV